MTPRQQLKQILIDLAVNDELPMDLTQFDESLFDPVINPLLERISELESKETILGEIYDNHPQIAEMYQVGDEG
jgi:hypothetical protein